MRGNPHFELDDPEVLKRIIRENPWATFVSAPSAGLVASHYPVVLDEAREEITLLSHVGRPDETLHELGRHELLVIVQGPHGYISPSWYGPAPAVPTWNFVVAHLYGTPEVLPPDENLEFLGALVDHFERPVDRPRAMRGTPADADFAQTLSRGTVGFRLTPERIVAKQKMSQNKAADDVASVLAELNGDGPYSDAGLAREMRLARRP